MESIVNRLLSFDAQENISLHGHTGPVWSVKPTSDDTTLFSGAEDYEVLIWDLQLEEVVGRLSGHKNTVNALELCLEEKILASGAWDGSIKLWNWRSQVEVASLDGHTAGVYVFAITKSSEILISGSGDYTARVWDVENRTCLAILNNAANSVFALALTPDETTLYTGGWNGILKEWNFSSYEEISSAQASSEAIQCMAITPNNSFLIYGTRGNKVRIQKLPEKTEYFCFENHNNWVRNLVVTQDSLYFISASADKTMRMVNILEKKEEVCFNRNDGYIFALCFGSNGKKLYSGASDKIVRIRNIGRVRDVKTFKGHTRCVMSVSIASNMMFMVTGSEDISVRKWSLVDFNQMWSSNFHSSTVWAVNVVESCEKILSVGGDHKLLIMSSDGNLLERLSGHSHPVFCVSSSICASYAATGGQDKNVILWNLDEKTSKKLEGHTDTVFSVKFIENDTRLLSGSADYTIRVWCLKSLTISTVIRSPGGMIESVSLSKDQKLMIVGDRKNLVTVWDWESLAQIKTLTIHKKWVKCVIFSNDSKFFASCSNDNTVRIWSSSELYQEFFIPAHKSTIRSVCFSPDGKFLVSVSEDCSAKLWPLELDDDLGIFDFVGDYEDFLFKKNVADGVLPCKEHLKLTFSKLRINILHYYAFVGNHQLLAEALKNEVLIKKDVNGKTPLFYSLHRNHWKCVDAFLEFILEKFYLKDVDIVESYKYFTEDFPLLIRFSNHSVALLVNELMPVSEQSDLSLFCFSNKKLPVVCCTESEKINRKDFEIKESKKASQPLYIRTSKIKIGISPDESLAVLEGIYQNRNKDVLDSDIIQAYYQLKMKSFSWIFNAELFCAMFLGVYSIYYQNLLVNSGILAGFSLKNFYQTKLLIFWIFAWFMLLSFDFSVSCSFTLIGICLVNQLTLSYKYKVLARCLTRIMKPLTLLTLGCRVIESVLIYKYQERNLENMINIDRYQYSFVSFLFGFAFLVSLLSFEMLTVTTDKKLCKEYWIASFHAAIKQITLLESLLKLGKFQKSMKFIHLCSSKLENDKKQKSFEDFVRKNVKIEE